MEADEPIQDRPAGYRREVLGGVDIFSCDACTVHKRSSDAMEAHVAQYHPERRPATIQQRAAAAGLVIAKR